MAAVQLSELRTRVRAMADVEDSDFFTDATLTQWLNNSLQSVYDFILQKFSGRYFYSTSSFNTAAGTSDYNLPTDFYKLWGVDLTLNGRPVALEAFDFPSRNFYRNEPLHYGGLYGVAPKYALVGTAPGVLRLFPAPDAVNAGTIHYAPALTLLSGPTDTVNFPNGWEEGAVIDTAIKCRVREESSIDELQLRKQEFAQRLEGAAENRDVSGPPQAVDVNLPYHGDFPWWW